MKIDPIPPGYHTVTPYLAVHDVPGIIKFLKQAFAAEEIERHTLPDGSVLNAAIRIGNSIIIMGETPANKETRTAVLYLYVEDADTLYLQALKAGGKSIMEMTDQFYGDRSGAVEDPSGNQWWIASRIENLSHEELLERARKYRK